MTLNARITPNIIATDFVRRITIPISHADPNGDDQRDKKNSHTNFATH
jgi:hypothetical protein